MHPHDFSYAIDAFCSCCLFYTFALPYRLNSCYRYQNHLSLALHLSFRRILPELRCFVDTFVRLLIGLPVRFCDFLSSGIKKQSDAFGIWPPGFPDDLLGAIEFDTLVRLICLFCVWIVRRFGSTVRNDMWPHPFLHKKSAYQSKRFFTSDRLTMQHNR